MTDQTNDFKEPEGTNTPANILLVEDQRDNQILITALLGKLGHKTTIAENGLEAVNLLNETSFDLVFMDIQMPVMDGVTATRRIRASGNTTPILALTAHAQPENRENCMVAGCNDFYTKPISKKELAEAVEKWASTTNTEVEEKSEAVEGIPQSPSDPIHSTLLAQDPEFEPLITDFVQSLPNTLQGIQETLDALDHPTLAGLAHKVKGTGGGYGYNLLSEIGAGLEDASKVGDHPLCIELVDKLTNTVERILEGLAQPIKS